MGLFYFFFNLFFFDVTFAVDTNIVLLQLKQDSSPQVRLTIADSSDVFREYFTLITEKLPWHKNEKDQS